MSQPIVGAMVLVHNRHQLLATIVDQVARTWDDWRVHFTADRPTSAVLDECWRLVGKYGPRVKILDLPFPVVGPGGEQFMAARNYQLSNLQHDGCPTFLALWDDDHILEDPTEHAAALQLPNLDLTYIEKVYFWDDVRHVNPHLFRHYSPFWYRTPPLHSPDKFPLDRIIHAPATVHDHPREEFHFKSRLLDTGYLTAPERVAVFQRYARAGKLDGATLPLMGKYVPDLFSSSHPGYKDLIAAYE